MPEFSPDTLELFPALEPGGRRRHPLQVQVLVLVMEKNILVQEKLRKTNNTNNFKKLTKQLKKN